MKQSETKTLYIHIGTHKTGTTSLQYFLNSNNIQLQKNGFCYPYIKNNCTRADLSAPHINGSFLIEPKESDNFILGLKKLRKLLLNTIT